MRANKPVSCHIFFQDAEGDEEEDDDPDYQPPPVSLKCQLIHTLHTDGQFLEYRFVQERNRLKGDSKAKKDKNLAILKDCG